MCFQQWIDHHPVNQRIDQDHQPQEMGFDEKSAIHVNRSDQEKKPTTSNPLAA
jgi:hypothetical protein